MASKLDLRSYFGASEDIINDSRVSIPEIISSVSNDVCQAEIDMSKEEVKTRRAKRNNYQNIPEEVRKEVGKHALINGIIAAIDRYSKFYPKFDLKCSCVNI